MTTNSFTIWWDSTGCKIDCASDVPRSCYEAGYLAGSKIDYEKQYNELVDALCSKSWLGRTRHASVVALAKRLQSKQLIIRPLELEDIAKATGYCTRKEEHDGPCNGLPRNSCPQKELNER